MGKNFSHFFCSKSYKNGVPNRIHFVLLRNNEEVLELVRNILREVSAEREALCLEWPHHAPWGGAGCPHSCGPGVARRPEPGFQTLVGTGRPRLQGVTESCLTGTTLHLTLPAGNLWETRIFRGSVFHGHKRVTSLNESEKFTVCWLHATTTLFQWEGKLTGLKLNSLSLKMFNTIYSFNGFPLPFFLFGKVSLSSF